MRRASTLAVSAILLPSVLALAACAASSTDSAATGTGGAPAGNSSATAPAAAQGPSNVGLTSAAANAAINDAVKTATALQAKGAMVSDGSTITMNLQFDQNSAAGTLTAAGATVPFVSINGTSYIQITPGLLQEAGQDPSSATSKLVLNKWVSSTTQMGASIASSFGPFMSLSAFTSEVTGSADDLTADGTGTLNGVPVAKYKDVDNTQTPPSTEELYLPATGPALPVQVSGTGTAAGAVTFVWNKPTTIVAPPSSEIYAGS